MNKILISAILCIGLLVPTAAQDENTVDTAVNKRGIALLPEAGEFAIGFDANPFLSYLGGFLGGNSGSFGLEGFNQTIYGKYFLEYNTAIRAKIRLNFNQNKVKNTISNDHALLIDPTNIAATVVDTRIFSDNSVHLFLGYEKRRGKGRVQGFYGGELHLGYDGGKTKYDYGNPITESNQSPSSSWGTGVTQGYRTLESKNGARYSAGLGGFVGVEYFFAPQISIGGELSLDFSYSIKGQNEYTTEGFLGNEVQKYKYRARNWEDAFNVGLQTNTYGNIFLMFHF